jgi:photosystem II stability/assembly factor-like uncharacterized protein
MKQHYRIFLFSSVLISSVFAKDMGFWEKIDFYFERKKAVKEWQSLIHKPDINYQNALVVFAKFDEKFAASSDEKEVFRNWKKSVRNRATPDGLIVDPKINLAELKAFRENLRQATPNDAEKPIYYPAPMAAANQKISLSLPNPSNAGYWISAGYRGIPDVAGGATGNGAATGVTMDPNSPNIIYACVRNAGLWKSFNYGKTYEPMTDYFESPYCDGVGIGKNNSNVLYLLQSGKIWYTDDAGMSWENRSTGFTGPADEVHVDPQNSNRALTAGEKGLFLTTDAGLTWTKVLDGVFREIETTSDWSTLGIAKDAGNPNASFFMSTDKGATWTEKTIAADRTGLNRLYLAFHERTQSDSLIIYGYLLKSSNTPTRFYGLYRSNDRGNTFNEVKAPGYAYPNGIVAVSGDSAGGYNELGDGYGGVNPYTTSSWVSEFWVSPANPNHMITMREKLWYSINGGQTWNYGPSYGEAGWADRRFATSNPTKDTLWICDDGGLAAVAFADLFPWQGNSSKYHYKNGTIAASEGTNLGISAYNKDVFLTGGQDAGQVFQRNGKSSHVHKVDVYRGDISPYNDSVYWTASISFRITDTTRLAVSNQVVPDRFDPLRIYGFNGNTLYRTRKGSNAWSFSDAKTEANASTTGVNQSNAFAELVNMSTSGVSSWNAWTFEQSRAEAEVAYMGDESGKRLFKTNNLSDSIPTWTALVNAPALSRYRIATHPLNPKLVAVAGDKAVWISRDAGTTWTELKGFVASGAINILFDPNTAEGLYVCNSMTVWYRDESMSSWIEFNRGLPLQQIVEMKMAHYADGESRLWIAKYGRGVWSTPLYSYAQKHPVHADFGIHSLTKKGSYFAGDSIAFYDLSSGEISSRAWSVTGPDSEKVILNQTMPKFGFSKVGLYNINLKITGPQGSDSVLKKGYIRILPAIKNVDSSFVAQNGGAWYLGISSVNVNGLAHNSNGNTNLFYEDLTKSASFQATLSDSVSVSISPTQNDGTWGVSYAKVYIDFNNSGSFDSTEMVYGPSTKNQGHIFKFLPPKNVQADFPIRMRVLVNRLSTIAGPYASQATQGQVEDHTITFNSPKPIVTVQVNSPSADSISLAGTVVLASGIIDQGFIYTRFKKNPEMGDPGQISTQTQSSTFAKKIGGLPKNSTYYVRAYVVDSRGTTLSAVDSIRPQSFVMPVLEALSAQFDTTSKKWSASARINAEGQIIDSIFMEYGVDNAWNNSALITSPAGARSAWDTVSYTFNQLPRYSNIQYRIKASIAGQIYTSAPQSFNSEKDLYAYWSFDDSGSVAKDYSGNKRHATLGAGLTRASDGHSGMALSFDSTADVATLGLANLPQPFSVLFRVKRSQNSPIGNAVILDGSSRRLDLEGWNNTRKLALQAQTLYDRSSTYSAPLNEWHHIALSAKNDSVKIYVDGVFHSSLAAASYQLPLNTFGKNGASMFGLLDEVKVYQRALGLSEIQQYALLLANLQMTQIPQLRVGDAPLTIQTSTSSTQSVRITITQGVNLVSLIGNQLKALNPGKVTIMAVVDANSIYAADTILQSFEVLPAQVVGTIQPQLSQLLNWKITPNPVQFSKDQQVEFSLQSTEIQSAHIGVYDIGGRQIFASALNSNKAGLWSAQWNLNKNAKMKVKAGQYYVKLQIQNLNGSVKAIQGVLPVVY